MVVVIRIFLRLVLANLKREQFSLLVEQCQRNKPPARKILYLSSMQGKRSRSANRIYDSFCVCVLCIHRNADQSFIFHRIEMIYI